MGDAKVDRPAAAVGQDVNRARTEGVMIAAGVCHDRPGQVRALKVEVGGEAITHIPVDEVVVGRIPEERAVQGIAVEIAGADHAPDRSVVDVID